MERNLVKLLDTLSWVGLTMNYTKLHHAYANFSGQITLICIKKKLSKPSIRCFAATVYRPVYLLLQQSKLTH